ncbi:MULTISPECIES: carbohydrate ABC transporter permease [Streptomyces]|jgi:multiple sugar transport system permease protein|uniref:Multiple sugar transport system permease protein n=2 Tax=Streptomyces TaxID=1883 RepID=A0A514JM07_9ACTN|nr:MULTISPECIES: carbohydrate ABC transporter permease [Streptomyces]MBA8942506.1 multiple sugar transport system permease protein [Streptomyces calvus]MBA8975530.1 multiple sugar transport system permease protein [Streptomyces calvus]MYS31552.1 ABC transporter permease subunit [Streptomyces sp. SID7804]QDI68349.1 sugar ABC transporter permease [Streptomyces calvus]GGP68952.1 sugar ABC transporter permease [Streptomyces calvus]
MTRRTVARALVYLSLVLATLVVLLPLAVVLLTSLKSSKEMANGSGALALPDDPLNLDNYVTAFRDGQMLSAFGNTAIVLVVAVGGTILIGSMTAYAVDRFHFRFRKLVVALFLLAALVPGVTTQVATFQIVNSFGMFDSLWAPIALYMGTDIVSIYIFLQFIRSIPVSLDEAARLDGANAFTVYRKVIFPLLKPAIATVVIVKGITVYNDFYIPFLYMPSEDLGVISTSLFRFKGPFGAHWETISAGAILVILPTLIVFLFLQRFIYNGFMRGATK